jgi:hypothetical protein
MKISHLIVSSLALTHAGCSDSGKSTTREQVGPATSFQINYPLPTASDPLNLRACPLNSMYVEMTCRSIGTKGSIRKITWYDTFSDRPEATVEFDKHGEIYRICKQGRADFQGWACGTSPFKNPTSAPQRTLDKKGRILETVITGYEGVTSAACSYIDGPQQSSSECGNGLYVYKYVYDASGRAISYGKRRVPEKGESTEVTERLGKADSVDVIFRYTDDLFGNWTTIQAVGNAGDKTAFEINRRRTIEYY